MPDSSRVSLPCDIPPFPPPCFCSLSRQWHIKQGDIKRVRRVAQGIWAPPAALVEKQPPPVILAVHMPTS